MSFKTIFWENVFCKIYVEFNYFSLNFNNTFLSVLYYNNIDMNHYFSSI